jgi:hypothetical protein
VARFVDSVYSFLYLREFDHYTVVPKWGIWFLVC